MTRSAGRRPNARPDACLGFRSFGSAVLAAMIVVLLTQAAGCVSPEARHSWLSFLFDGVPPLSEPGA